MSKLIYILHKNLILEQIDQDRKKITLIGDRISPDNIEPNPTKFLSTDNSICAIFNPVSTIDIKDTSVCLGFSLDMNWDILDKRAEAIEGTYSIFRNSANYFQVVTDMVASRTVWYYMDDNIFIASSSQRAIVMYLESFKFNDMVIPWMLSSGTLGPGYSYDRRLSMLEPNSLLSLNKKEWKLKKDMKQLELKNIYPSKLEAKNELKRILDSVFENFNIDNDKFVLPLSGGYDSRAILLFLNDKKNLRTITWGAKESLDDEENDAYIAKSLAAKYEIEHKYFESFKADVAIKETLDRFLATSEGRIDHVGGYLDGMAMWKSFFENGYECLIRGDELLGLSVPNSELEARRAEGITLLSDYYNISNEILSKFKPQKYKIGKYDDIYRLKGYLAVYNEHPVVFAALNDIKLSYVEIFNPLLSTSLLKAVFSMFDKKIIGDKEIFKNIVDEICPDIPIAKRGANKPLDKIASSLEMKKELLSCFNSLNDNDVIDTEIVEMAIKKISNVSISNIKGSRTTNKTQLLRKFLPSFVYNFIKANSTKRELDWHSFAFRLYILIRMGRIFNEDAEILIRENA